MAMTATRESFQFSRALEYVSNAELTKQMGYGPTWWPLLVAKELVDNALDNCEEIGVQPDITVCVTDSTISVQDNGSGIEPATVRGMLDFNVRESSREVFRSLTRGRQGNAGKCILAVPYVLAGGNPEHVAIEARGVRHAIRVAIDQLAQQPRVEYSTEPSKVHSGTRVTVPFPSKMEAWQIDEFVHQAQSFAALNSHLSIVMELGSARFSAEATSGECQKWTAAKPDPPAWYDLPAFERLVGACIHKDRSRGADRPLGEFLQGFDGLKRSGKRKAVTDAVGLTRRGLSCLLNGDGLDHEKTRALLSAIQDQAKSPKPEALGMIGKQHAEYALGCLNGVCDIKYRSIKGVTEEGLPYVVEAAFARLDAGSERVLISGCNFSPTLEHPVFRGLDWLLVDQKILCESPVAVLFHVVTPNPNYLDRGKSVLEVTGQLAEDCRKCVTSVTAEYCREQKQKERDAARWERATERRAAAKSTTLKEAVFNVLEQAVEETSSHGTCEFSARDLYYAARPLIQAYTERSLTQKYFDKTVDDWEREHGLINGRLRDPRGYLIEPHTHKKIPLGTKAVDDYTIPLHLYHTILYFEKKGMEAKCAWGKIPERYDCAVMACEGYAVRAAKSLIQAAQKGHKITVLCFHDADPAGYNIFRTLSRSSGIHHYKIKVIDAGLHLEEALQMGLQTENFTRKKALFSKLKLTDFERRHFEGKRAYGGGIWTGCQRVELNALSKDPQRFVEWVESKLEKYGVAKKLVPGKSVVNGAARLSCNQELHQRIRSTVNGIFDIDAMVMDVADKIVSDIDVSGLHGELGTWAADLPPQWWRDQLDWMIRGRIDPHDEDIDAAVTDAIRRTVEHLGGGSQE